ncbi:hypothetical protein PHYBLDRAFT_167081 [Phycomyces blakesleeanus NRRL 1555(-)]|uniref:Uncharacterized protein n=1 Tax=Phycomyces blakesleeanus (strain ATCC 8743b / DSM 1359 / FGSC 10004 / NBRC 33097 / NRRL 1555) TaxID=763407 RepID=A0A162UAA1_PHYB8|nr:hypothetical protein PHYBLDRAFT_167081 [Phycomyces blakesleeanus NRRL 1555(-)]OAD74732.1 hypothetical protein PHYBLDRAFT_167081 [Phycomyces blakesleeanus NRRL 1555(-)]|eukprot:XP_018292772.1 hypothetical protein PHYBLDRAFT_167081 [Phycomyces blakesleeanus NRRL 1555(-)]
MPITEVITSRPPNDPIAFNKEIVTIISEINPEDNATTTARVSAAIKKYMDIDNTHGIFLFTDYPSTNRLNVYSRHKYPQKKDNFDRFTKFFFFSLGLEVQCLIIKTSSERPVIAELKNHLSVVFV